MPSTVTPGNVSVVKPCSFSLFGMVMGSRPLSVTSPKSRLVSASPNIYPGINPSRIDETTASAPRQARSPPRWSWGCAAAMAEIMPS